MSNDVVSCVGDLCRRPALTVRPSDRLRDAAERMTRAGVGCVVVEREGRPVAVLTDRDLALDVLCAELDADAARVEDVMGHAPITIFEGEPLHAAAERIRAARVRRLPVVDADGMLVGLLAADDLMLHAARRLARVCEVIHKQLSAHREEPRGRD
jgi:CBS domain-containing protein